MRGSWRPFGSWIASRTWAWRPSYVARPGASIRVMISRWSARIGEPLGRGREAVAVGQPLVLLPAGADAEDRPPAADDVDGRDRLGGQAGVAVGRGEDEVAKPGPARRDGHGRQLDERLEDDAPPPAADRPACGRRPTATRSPVASAHWATSTVRCQAVAASIPRYSRSQPWGSVRPVFTRRRSPPARLRSRSRRARGPGRRGRRSPARRRPPCTRDRPRGRRSGASGSPRPTSSQVTPIASGRMSTPARSSAASASPPARCPGATDPTTMPSPTGWPWMKWRPVSRSRL